MAGHAPSYISSTPGRRAEALSSVRLSGAWTQEQAWGRTVTQASKISSLPRALGRKFSGLPFFLL